MNALLDPEKLLSSLSRAEKHELLKLLERQEAVNNVTQARKNLLDFARAVYPNFKEGPQHRMIWQVLEDVLLGRKKRVIINIGPRFGKSLLVSYLFVAFYLGWYPDKKVIMATHTSTLSEDFGRMVRNLLRDPAYGRIFPKTSVAPDQKAAGQWSTTAKGQYYAVGIGGALAGRGADLLITDDPHSEQDVKAQGTAVFDKAWAWYQTGPLQRLMPGGSVVVIMTRWSELDLTGRLVDYSIRNPDADQWEVIQLPAILPSGKSLWPEQWPVEELLQKKASMDIRFWSAQYEQNPTSEEGALLKRDWWKMWVKESPPPLDFVIITLDGAFTAKQSSNFSALTVWGIWHEEGENTPMLILLDAFRDRIEFPELKDVAYKHYKEWERDTEGAVSFVIEAKASGLPLLQELRAMGVPATDYTPSRGNDKIARVNAITDLFASGMVWAPDTRWAKEVVEECARFPNGATDDYVDCVSMALLRFRQGGFIKLPTDEKDDETVRKRRGAYTV